MGLIDYDSDLVGEVAARLALREPNRRALDAIARAFAASDNPIEVVCDLATAVGKTWIAAGLVDYLADSGVRNILIVTPRTSVQTKTISNFTTGNAKFIEGLSFAPLVITIDDFERGTVGAALAETNVLKLFVINIQQLLKPSDAMRRRIRDYDETLGASLYEYLRKAEDLVIIADEHHTYYGDEFSPAMRLLDPIGLVGLTGTPHENTPPEQIIYRYSLAEAIADGYVKIPVLVGRRDKEAGFLDRLADGLTLLEWKDQAVKKWCEQSGDEYVPPVMFVVTQEVLQANETARHLRDTHFDGNVEAVLVVHNKNKAGLDTLVTIEDADSPIRVVVSVDQLKEGWDARNVYVICAERALESQTLTEQILGRGLRLPFGERTGVSMLDTVEVVTHRKFADLLKEAEVYLEAIVQERAAMDTIDGYSQSETVVPEFELIVNGGSEGGSFAGVVVGGEDASTLIEGATFEDRETVAGDALSALSTTIALVQGAPFISFPLLQTRLSAARFTLSDVPDGEFIAAGQKFTTEIDVWLEHVRLDATRDGDKVKLLKTPERERIAAHQQEYAVDSLTDSISRLLLGSGVVESTKQEKGAARRLIKAFLLGAGVGDPAKAEPWSQARSNAAIAYVKDVIRLRRQNTPAAKVDEIHIVRYPPVPLPCSPRIISRYDTFERNVPMEGWTRSILPIASFDAKSTEFEIATMLDAAEAISWWIRILTGRTAFVEWGNGQRYFPDFLALDTAGTAWMIEGKADSDVGRPDVLAKKEAAGDGSDT